MQTELFIERQRFSQLWIWFFIIAISLFFIYGLVQQLIMGIPFGNNPASDWGLTVLSLVFAFGFPLVFWNVKLITVVKSDGIYFKYFPFLPVFQIIPWGKIISYELQTYYPIREFGGWGIRFNKLTVAYTVKGDQGLLIEIEGKKRKTLLGTQKKDELKKAIEKALKDREDHTGPK